MTEFFKNIKLIMEKEKTFDEIVTCLYTIMKQVSDPKEELI